MPQSIAYTCNSTFKFASKYLSIRLGASAVPYSEPVSVPVPVELSPQDAGSALQPLTVGATWSVRLPANPTTGYRWELLPIDPPLVHQVGDATFEPTTVSTPPRVGAGGIENFLIQADAPGQVTLHWVYRRPWETHTEPAQTWQVMLRVR
jgi:inhibitor of cysteine peptidase